MIGKDVTKGQVYNIQDTQSVTFTGTTNTVISHSYYYCKLWRLFMTVIIRYCLKITEDMRIFYTCRILYVTFALDSSSFTIEIKQIEHQYQYQYKQ